MTAVLISSHIFIAQFSRIMTHYPTPSKDFNNLMAYAQKYRILTKLAPTMKFCTMCENSIFNLVHSRHFSGIKLY